MSAPSDWFDIEPTTPTDGDGKTTTLKDIAAKGKKKTDAPPPDAPTVTYAALADRMNNCADADIASLILDEGRALPADQQADLQKLYDAKFAG